MANPLECRSCGYICHSEDTKCPYCGTPTSHGTERKTYHINKPELPDFTFTSKTRETPESSSDINVCLLIFLVIIFWPAALIYVIVKIVNKNK